jgi:hypothetical protein
VTVSRNTVDAQSVEAAGFEIEAVYFNDRRTISADIGSKKFPGLAEVKRFARVSTPRYITDIPRRHGAECAERIGLTE